MVPSPLVSVVIPCYNQGHFLAEAISSVRAACSTPPVEIIVVDDGSTDDTRAVAERFDHVQVFSQPNARLAGARNRGLKEARGDYVVFVDADDRLAPGGIDAGVAAAAAHPECALVFGRCLMMSSEGAVLPTPLQPRIERDHYRELLLQNYIWMPAMAMIRREALQSSGAFTSDANAAADYELYLRIARKHRIYDHATVVAHYRRHDTNMSGNATRMLRETLAVLRAQWPFVQDAPDLVLAYRQGWRNWQDLYGTELVNEIRAHVRGREWLPALSKVATLAHLHPRGLGHHARQKFRVAVSRRPPEPEQLSSPGRPPAVR
jgi:glycosyltransferase involved in cell wall biosynthesis